VEGNQITVQERILLASRNAECNNHPPNAVLLGHKEWKEMEEHANRLFSDTPEGNIRVTLTSKSTFMGMRLLHIEEDEALFVANVNWPARPPAHFSLDRQYGSHLP
jgi:hypothetical protein